MAQPLVEKSWQQATHFFMKAAFTLSLPTNQPEKIAIALSP
ncbi:hypothetical protein [Nostoc sp.]